MIRKAKQEDIRAVVRIYDAIHTQEEAGRLTTGWKRGIYPTKDTAVDALAKGSLYVLERDGAILASARIDQTQMPAYREAHWMYEASDEDILVLHTLTVDPVAMGRGCGTEFMAYYEEYARENGFGALRTDTNARNTCARAFYHRLGYREAGIVPCVFNGLKDVQLVCLEKPVQGKQGTL